MAQNTAAVLAETGAGVSVILVAGSLLVPVLRRVRQPPVIAEIAAGILLGPSLLGLLPGDLPDRLFPQETRSGLSSIAQVGILLFMFLIGWEADPGRIRERPRTVLGISLSAIAVPFATGVALAYWLYTRHDTVAGHHVEQTPFVLFVGTAMAITAFPVLARIILEHRLQHTRVGVLALASAAIGDALAWCMLAVVSVVTVASGSGHLLTMAGGSLLYAVVLVAVVRPLLRVLVDRLTRDDMVSPRLLPLVAAGVFPPLSEFASFTDSLLALALGYRTVYGVLGCYITARLVSRRPMAHAMTLGVIGFGVGVAGAIATWDAWTSWYSLAIIAVTLPSAWLGGRLSSIAAK